MFKRRSIFHRLFISYIFVTLIPVALLFVLLYKNSVVNLRNEVESFNQEMDGIGGQSAAGRDVAGHFQTG